MGVERFIYAQDKIWDNVIQELSNGYKETHWMWFIFPQRDGLGYSDIAKYFEIQSLDELREYEECDELMERYRECLALLLKHHTFSAYTIFGSIDERKLQSSLTLFSYVSSVSHLCNELLDHYFNGLRDESTDEWVNEQKVLD